MGAGHIGGGGEELHPYLIHQCYPRLAKEMTSSCTGLFGVQGMTSELRKTSEKYHEKVKARNYRLTMAGAA